VATVTRSVSRAGGGTIAWDGKVKKNAAPKGVYQLAVRAETKDGQFAVATAKVTLAAAKKKRSRGPR
jgi:hypothetical protein